MSEDIQEEIEQGPVNPQRPNRALALTLVGMLLLAAVAGAFGVGSTLIGANRRNENLVPRTLEVYALLPEGGLRYVLAERPADQILADDDLPFENTERAFTGAAFEQEDHITSEEVYGGTLVEKTPTTPPGDATATRYLLERDITDGQVLGVRMTLSQSPNLSTDGSATVFTLPVAPQDTVAQRIVAVAVPRGAEVLSFSGPEAYRQTRVGGWQVLYFDVTILDGETTINVAADLSGTTAPARIDIPQFEVNR
jgi:hypothetical protein